MSVHLFTKRLLEWHSTQNDRQLPWKSERNPYRIWLSEIMLQQTRAEQGLPYYNAFITKYPTIVDLANADDQAVFKMWQGLGYYARCKNMLAAARIVRDQYAGIFPDTYEAILALPGVGPYTAAAISSFAFGLSYPVVDGNVYRVLSRFFNIHTPIDYSGARKEFTLLASDLIESVDPAVFNQAIMDFGASVCKPTLPSCTSCVLADACYAYAHRLETILPIKAKKLVKKHRHFIYVIIAYNDQLYFEMRRDKDIWKDLYQPYLIERIDIQSVESIKKEIAQLFNVDGVEYLEQHKQVLTHQYIHSYWFAIKVDRMDYDILKNGAFYNKNLLKKLPLPKTIFSVMSKNNYF